GAAIERIPDCLVDEAIDTSEYRTGSPDILAPVVSHSRAELSAAEVDRIASGDPAAAEYGGVDRGERAGKAGTLLDAGHTAAELAADRIAERIELCRQPGNLFDDHPAEAGYVVVDRDAIAGAGVRRVAEGTIVGHRAIAAADMRLERRAPARAPQHAGIPDQAVGLIGDLAGRTLVGDEPTVRPDHRVAKRIAPCIAARHFDVLVADTAHERDVGAHGDGHVRPDMPIAYPLVEVGDVLLGPAATHAGADRRHRVRSDACASIGAMRRTF